MKAKIIVTGGCGYIGSHTAIELIKNDFDVIILMTYQIQLTKPFLEYIKLLV